MRLVTNPFTQANPEKGVSDTEVVIPSYWQQGREAFLQQRYFEAHEAWEVWWLTLPKVAMVTEVLQALIQCCALGVHVQQGNLRGVRLKYVKIQRRLQHLQGLAWPEQQGYFPEFQGERWQQTLTLAQPPACLASANQLVKAWHACF